MFTPRHIDRPAIVCGLVCLLLLAAVMSSAAARDGARTSSLAGRTSTPWQDLRSPDSRDADEIALAPLQSPVASDDAPWLPIVPSVTATLPIVAAGAALLRRLRIRRRRAARATT